jgi:hypothetical protein
MPKFRKKPVVIEAFMYGFHVEPEWFSKSDAVSFGPGIGQVEGDGMPPDAFIETLEGKMRVGYYDWVIKGVKGELYPCKNEIFEATYEEVAEHQEGTNG